MIRRSVGACMMSVVVAAGCNSLAYVHNATGGLELSAAPTEGTVRLVAGGDRETFAMVPKKDRNNESDAMSVLAVSRVQLAGLRNLKFGHAIATGKPAVLIGQRPDDLGKLVDKVFGDEATTGTAGGAAGGGGGGTGLPVTPAAPAAPGGVR